jgi:hypothetical protein
VHHSRPSILPIIFVPIIGRGTLGAFMLDIIIMEAGPAVVLEVAGD